MIQISTLRATWTISISDDRGDDDPEHDDDRARTEADEALLHHRRARLRRSLGCPVAAATLCLPRGCSSMVEP